MSILVQALRHLAQPGSLERQLEHHFHFFHVPEINKKKFLKGTVFFCFVSIANERQSFLDAARILTPKKISEVATFNEKEIPIYTAEAGP